MDRKLWEPFLRFESRDYLSKHYQKRHSRSLGSQRAHEIGSCFTQGRQYFASASTASDTVKPLLIYYGVASLARGATMLKSRDKREESLTPGHGLTTIDWNKTLHGGIANVLGLQVQATRGTFSEFVEAVGNGQSYTWIGANNRAGHFKNDFGAVKFLTDGSQLSLRDLLSRETQLATEYEIANDGWGNTDLGNVVALDHCIRVHLLPTAGTDVARATESYGFPASAKVSLQPSPIYPQIQTICIEIPSLGEDRKKVVPMSSGQDQNVGFLVRPLPNGDNFIDLHRVFVETYILGMLSRYFPSKWMSLLRSEKGDIARSLVLAAVARAEMTFPALLQDQLH